MKFFILIIFVFFSSSIFADQIYLKNGDIISGQILRVTASSIEYKPGNDKPFNLVSMDDAQKIIYDSGKEVFISDSLKEKKPQGSIILNDGRIIPYRHSGKKVIAKDIKDNRYKTEYPVFGIVNGNPCLYNFLLGYYFNNFGFHVSGMIFFSDMEYTLGTRLNLLTKLYERKDKLISVSASFGYLGASVDNSEEYYYDDEIQKDSIYRSFYGGVSLLINIKDFHLELGLAGNYEKNNTGGIPEYLLLPFSGLPIYPLVQIGYVHRFNNL